jgi:hypothetical protein
MSLKKGVLKSFDAVSYTAAIALSGSYKAYLEDVTVARNIATAQMVAGRNVAVFFPDEHNAKEAVVVAVYM